MDAKSKLPENKQQIAASHDNASKVRIYILVSTIGSKLPRLPIPVRTYNRLPAVRHSLLQSCGGCGRDGVYRRGFHRTDFS